MPVCHEDLGWPHKVQLRNSIRAGGNRGEAEGTERPRRTRSIMALRSTVLHIAALHLHRTAGERQSKRGGHWVRRADPGTWTVTLDVHGRLAFAQSLGW